MTDTLQMPLVHECTVTGCGYNHGGCHAFAITIGRENANCATFIDTAAKGGLDKVIAQVGACMRTDCRHNSELECRAPSIRVGPGQDQADCQTYEPR
ncbi:uncharacterized protein DUF1540 [Krasilnikovia cinnamomea]|uniref:Uncharacterized protein DUF1540 n=1 Tax=Krasilnikovia cinnamomea TaxID=349313 RepID=A0A4V2G7Z4_9ACTN|nr:DUF1540 domain-containing protein [Krasilnikovia cinnamomea]RZU54486.1 uncharacterized protein DUF1540 [Krasilnikovia cinnamomea]